SVQSRTIALIQAKRGKCHIDMLEMNIQRAKAIDLRLGKSRRDLRFAFYVFSECPLSFPSLHGRALHCFVRALAFCTCASEREQDRLTEIQTFRQLEILLHPLGIDLQAI